MDNTAGHLPRGSVFACFGGWTLKDCHTTKCVPVHFLNKLRHTLILRNIVTFWTSNFFTHQIVIFRTILAFQMSELEMLEKNYFRFFYLTIGRFLSYAKL